MNHIFGYSRLACKVALGVVLVCTVVDCRATPLIVNSSFEGNPPAGSPGYGPVANWTASGANSGVNNTSGPFWDNGVTTSGTQVAFIQSPNFLAQNVAGFEANKSYELRMLVNSRRATPIKPRLRVSVAGAAVVTTGPIASVSATGLAGTGNTFWGVTAQFPSPGPGTFELKIENLEGSGDNTMLLDAVEIVEIPNLAPVASLGGSALAFDGIDSYVQFARPVQGDFTIEFWFKSTEVTGGDVQWWQGKGLVDGEVPGAADDFGVTLGAGKVLFGIGNPDVTIQSGVKADGAWHHVAATREAASGTIKLYVDGALASSGTAGTQSLTAPPDLRLGSLQTNLGFYDGLLDEVRIWNKVLSSFEIGARKANQRTGSETGLVRYYRLDNTTGTVALDSSASAANGTLVNGPAWRAGSPGINEVNTPLNTDAVVTLAGFDANASALTAKVTSLPAQGVLYQYNAGSRGAAITVAPTTITDAQSRVIFAPDAGESGTPYTSFQYVVNDGIEDSTPATVSVKVASPSAAADWQMFE
ncbi:MAG: LamG domain-containing protein [Candidatus Sumerlaeaceae bacterium]